VGNILSFGVCLEEYGVTEPVCKYSFMYIPQSISTKRYILNTEERSANPCSSLGNKLYPVRSYLNRTVKTDQETSPGTDQGTAKKKITYINIYINVNVAYSGV